MWRTRKVLIVVVLGATGSVIGVTAASAGGGCHGGTSQGRGSSIEMIDACFTPTTLHSQPGDTITFTNRDGFDHNVTGTGWERYEELGPGEGFSMSFADAGVYPYACTLHMGMSGAIVIGDGDEGTGVAAVNDADLPSSADPTHTDRWILAGLVGLALGATAGAGISSIFRHAPQRALGSPATPSSS